MTAISVRHYQNSDRAAIYDISADTAFFGEPVEAFMEDRNLYCGAFARYYIDYQTSFVWLADYMDCVVGFLLGCADTVLYNSGWRRYIISRVLMNAVSGKYRLGKRTASFAFGMLMGMIRGEEPRVDLTEYPAHLQIDVKQEYRGNGIGKGLMITYLEQLKGLGVGGVHLETTSHNQAACHVYEKIGFNKLDSRLNRFLTRRLGERVDGKSDTVSRNGAIISSIEEIVRVEQLRVDADAIMVGGRTPMENDRHLTVKAERLHRHA